MGTILNMKDACNGCETASPSSSGPRLEAFVGCVPLGLAEQTYSHESRGKESEGAKECPCLLLREQRARARAWTRLEGRQQGMDEGLQRGLPCGAPRARNRAQQGVEGRKPRSHERAAPCRLRREHREFARLR